MMPNGEPGDGVTTGPPRGIRRGLLATPAVAPSASPTASGGNRGLRTPNSIDGVVAGRDRLRSSWGRSPATLSASSGKVPELHGLIAKVSAVVGASSGAAAPSAAVEAGADADASDSRDDDGGGAGLAAWIPILDRIKSHPTEAAQLDRRGRTALHAACTRRPPPVAVSALIDAIGGRRGGSVSVQDNHGATPLIMAIECGASLGCVRTLLKANGAAGISDHVGKLPLHLACALCDDDDESKERQVELVRLVLEAYPEGATKLNNKGRTPLHLAVEGGCRPEVVRLLVKVSPEAVIMDECGSTPLAFAIQHSSDVEIVRILVRANPQAVRKEDRSGLPLRKAVEYQASAPVIELLCDGPETVESVDSIGRTPLHLALQWSAYNFGVVRALLDKAPHVSRVKNRQGLTPLAMVYHHYARKARDEEDLANLTGRASQAWRAVLLMLRASRYGTVGEEAREWKVLHAALTTDVPVEVVRTAMAMRPQEVMEVDEDGRTPLSLALMGPAYSKSRIVDLLLDANPTAAQIPDVADGGRLPLVQAANYGWLSGEVVHKLIQCYPVALNTIDVATGLYPFQVAAVPKGGETEEDESNGQRTTREMLVQWGWEADKDMLQTNGIFELLQAAPDLLMHGIST